MNELHAEHRRQHEARLAALRAGSMSHTPRTPANKPRYTVAFMGGMLALGLVDVTALRATAGHAEALVWGGLLVINAAYVWPWVTRMRGR